MPLIKLNAEIWNELTLRETFSIINKLLKALEAVLSIFRQSKTGEFVLQILN